MPKKRSPGRPQGKGFDAMQKKVRGMRFAHHPPMSYRKIAESLGISHALAHYYGKTGPGEEEKRCHCCGGMRPKDV